jgi:hypothetical protein
MTCVLIAAGPSNKCLFPFAQWVHRASGMADMLVEPRNGPVTVDKSKCVESGRLLDSAYHVQHNEPVALCAPNNPSVDARSVLQKHGETSGRLVILYQAKQANTAETSRGGRDHYNWIKDVVSVVKATCDSSSCVNQDTYLIVLVSGHAVDSDDLQRLQDSVSKECGAYPIGVLLMSRSELQQSMPMFSHRFYLGSPRDK